MNSCWNFQLNKYWRNQNNCYSIPEYMYLLLSMDIRYSIKSIPLTFSVVCLCIVNRNITLLNAFQNRNQININRQLANASDSRHFAPFSIYYERMSVWYSIVDVSICKWARKVVAKTIVSVIWKHLMNDLPFWIQIDCIRWSFCECDFRLYW